MKRILLLLMLAALGQAQSYDDLVSRARESLRASQTAVALGQAQTAINADPNRWEAYIVAGTALSMLNRPDEAVQMLARSLPYAPADKREGIQNLIQQAQVARVAPPAPAVIEQTFLAVHEHSLSQCEGTLYVSQNGIRFVSPSHSIEINWPQLERVSTTGIPTTMHVRKGLVLHFSGRKETFGIEEYAGRLVDADAAISTLNRYWRH